MIGTRLYLFVGYPGAGKTTTATIIEKATGAYHLWVDRERQQRFLLPTHLPPENNELYRQLNAYVEELLEAKKSVIFDTNFNYRKDRDYLRQIANKHQAQTIIIWITTSRELSKQRATHDTHRQHNGYLETMSSKTFERLTNHLEPPTPEEPYIALDGTNIDKDKLLKDLRQWKVN